MKFICICAFFFVSLHDFCVYMRGVYRLTLYINKENKETRYEFY